MANLNSSFDEILTELADTFDNELAEANRKIVRSTANKLWLILRAFARGLFNLYQIVATLRTKFDPMYCSDEDLFALMRMTGTNLRQGKASLLTVVVWNKNLIEEKIFPLGVYLYSSVEGVNFRLELHEDHVIPANSFKKFDFYSCIGSNPLKGAYNVSYNTNITIQREDNQPIDIDFSFDCEDNSGKLGNTGETLFEFRKRILSDNKRQEILYILEERLKDLPNIHECSILYNPSVYPVSSPYLKDDGVNYVPIYPQTAMIILTGSPSNDFAKEFLSLCPFSTVAPEGVADYGVVYYESNIYAGGKFPIYFLKHRIENYNIIIKYGYYSRFVTPINIENALEELLLPLKSVSTYKELISTEDIFDLLSAYQNPSVKLLSIDFQYKGDLVKYIQLNKTQIAQLQTIAFQRVTLWE